MRCVEKEVCLDNKRRRAREKNNVLRSTRTWVDRYGRLLGRLACVTTPKLPFKAREPHFIQKGAFVCDRSLSHLQYCVIETADCCYSVVTNDLIKYAAVVFTLICGIRRDLYICSKRCAGNRV
jgi:hypothetical protein